MLKGMAAECVGAIARGVTSGVAARRAFQSSFAIQQTSTRPQDTAIGTVKPQNDPRDRPGTEAEEVEEETIDGNRGM